MRFFKADKKACALEVLDLSSELGSEAQFRLGATATIFNAGPISQIDLAGVNILTYEVPCDMEDEKGTITSIANQSSQVF